MVRLQWTGEPAIPAAVVVFGDERQPLRGAEAAARRLTSPAPVMNGDAHFRVLAVPLRGLRVQPQRILGVIATPIGTVLVRMTLAPALHPRTRMLAVPFRVPTHPVALVLMLPGGIFERQPRYRPKNGPPRIDSRSPSYASSS